MSHPDEWGTPEELSGMEERRRCICPDCGGGWTFDFAEKRVYCRSCEERRDEAQGSAK